MRSVNQQPHRYVITHPEWGIYLGECMGLGFWSKLDSCGQPAAVTFETMSDAEVVMSSWDSGRPAEAGTAPVVADDGEYASIAACVRAGLDGWLDQYTPVANASPF